MDHFIVRQDHLLRWQVVVVSSDHADVLERRGVKIYKTRPQAYAVRDSLTRRAVVKRQEP